MQPWVCLYCGSMEFEFSDDVMPFGGYVCQNCGALKDLK